MLPTASNHREIQRESRDFPGFKQGKGPARLSAHRLRRGRAARFLCASSGIGLRSFNFGQEEVGAVMSVLAEPSEENPRIDNLGLDPRDEV